MNLNKNTVVSQLNIFMDSYYNLIENIFFRIFETRYSSISSYLNSPAFCIFAIFYIVLGASLHFETGKVIYIYVTLLAVLVDIASYFLFSFIFKGCDFRAGFTSKITSVFFFNMMVFECPHWPIVLLDFFYDLRDLVFIIDNSDSRFILGHFTVHLDELPLSYSLILRSTVNELFLLTVSGALFTAVIFVYFWTFISTWSKGSVLCLRIDVRFKVSINAANSELFNFFFAKYFVYWALPCFFVGSFADLYILQNSLFIPFFIISCWTSLCVYSLDYIVFESFVWYFFINFIIVKLFKLENWFSISFVNNETEKKSLFRINWFRVIANLFFVYVLLLFWVTTENSSILSLIADFFYFIDPSYFLIFLFACFLAFFIKAALESGHHKNEIHALSSIFYATCMVVLYFVILITSFNYMVFVESVHTREVFVLINVFEAWFVHEPFPLFIFGYDYMTLLVCFMTSFVFTAVMYFSLHSRKLFYKRSYFWALFYLLFFVILSFLSINLFAFYFYFEATIIPTAYLIFQWGSSSKKYFAARQYVFYSVVGGLPLLAALANVYNKMGSLDYFFVLNNLELLSKTEQKFLWFSFFLVFAIKVPMFPFHSWLLNAHVEASTGVSIILAAVMLKIGIFGIIRYLLGLLHVYSELYSNYIVGLAVFAVFYASLSSITEPDLKRLVAYTSIAHMNLAVIGLFMFDQSAFYGAVVTMLSHAVISSAMFFLVGVLYSRFKTREIIYFGGLVQVMPLFSTIFFFFCIANSGFPCSFAFSAELFLFVSFFKKLNLIFVFIISVSAVLLLYANLRLFMYVCFGNVNENYCSPAITDLSHVELFTALILVFSAFVPFVDFNHFFSPLFIDFMSRYYIC